MINYALKDDKNNLFNLNQEYNNDSYIKTLTQKSDQFQFDINVVEFTNISGGRIDKNKRMSTREMELSFVIFNENSLHFRENLNRLMSFLFKTTYLVDLTNEIELEIVVKSTDINYEEGSLKKMAEISIILLALRPFWTEVQPTKISRVLSQDQLNNLSINNTGFIESSPFFTLTSSGPIPKIQIYSSETNRGIEIDSTTFGNVGYEKMTIDCLNGEVKMNEAIINNSILEGTGFFNLRENSDTLFIFNKISPLTFDMEFKKGYYI